jgi:rhodanese-related sulfurtransferase
MDENVPIIDIRRPDEWKSTGVIKGSHLLTFFDDKGDYDLDKWLQNLDKIVKKDQKFVLVCRSGNRTGQVTQFLDTQLHYTKVNHLKKGIKRWIGAGDQVVSAK